MKSCEFNQSYQVDRNAKGVRATTKTSEQTVPLTADGQPFDPSQTYFFFDGALIRQSDNLRLVGSFLGSLGMKVIPVSQVRANKDDALVDAQKVLIAKIQELREMVRELEGEKTPKNRTLKYVLMSKE